MNLWPPKQIHQGLLEDQLHLLFPLHTSIKNVKKEAAIKNPLTGGYLEVDVWLPEINLCFEFQDEHHFRPTWYAQLPLYLVQLYDNTKKNALLKLHQTLIAIPYWWDGKQESLKGTIQFHRPDLAHLSKATIPSNPSLLHVPGYKLLMLTSFPETIKIENKVWWWVGEKWDGIRCYWNAQKNRLYSRRNRVLNITPPMRRALHALMLDGELWCGRGSFLEAQNLMLSPWRVLNTAVVRFVCFDEASPHMHSQPFETRYSSTLSLLPANHPFAINAPRFACESEAVLMAALQSVTDSGGEGLILRKPHSRYLPGKSDSLFKIKASHSDQEALVVKVESDGSLLLQLTNGFTFAVPKKDCLLPQQAVYGDIVTFRFDFSKRMQFPGMPQSTDSRDNYPTNPIVYRTRKDIVWDDVTATQSLSFLVRKFGNEPNQTFKSRTIDSHTALLKRNLTLQKHSETTPYSSKRRTNGPSWKLVRDRRAYFDNFAASKGEDPLNPNFWYPVSRRELMRFHPGYQPISWYYEGKLSATIMQLYPDIGLQPSLFKDKQFERESERRAFFDKFAAAKGSNPLDPNFWYNVTAKELLDYHTDYYRITKFYQNWNLRNILLRLYPDIAWEKSRFKRQIRNLVSDKRAYFDAFAAAKGMDPLNPVFWYMTKAEDLERFQPGLKRIVIRHGGKYTSTITQIYPDIGLKKAGFSKFSRQVISERRDFFDQFAAAQGMNPLVPENWYGISVPALAKFHKGFTSLVNLYYGGYVSKALMELYPDIGLQIERFKAKRIIKSWPANAIKEFYDTFAASKQMDPLNPLFWYSVTKRNLMKYNEACSQSYYGAGRHMSSTLMQLYPNIGLQKSKFRVPLSTKLSKVRGEISTSGE